jgi:hypothetical protein
MYAGRPPPGPCMPGCCGAGRLLAAAVVRLPRRCSCAMPAHCSTGFSGAPMFVATLSLLSTTATSSPSPSSTSCTFCAANNTPHHGGGGGGASSHINFDLSSVLSTTVFTLHSGTRGSLADPWLTYYVTSPCGSVGSAGAPPAGPEMCFGGSTADPAAQHYTGTTPSGRYGVAPICSGLGSLGAATPPTIVYTPAAAAGATGAAAAAALHVTLHGGSTEWCDGTASVTYAMLCDPTVPSTNPPDSRVAVHGNCSFTVTWRHPSICAATNVTTTAGAPGCEGPPAPPAPPPAACEGCLPPWEPTWDMGRSTILYTCNSTGMHDVSEAVRYGVAAYDCARCECSPPHIGAGEAEGGLRTRFCVSLDPAGSNAKALWANAQPMNAEELLTKQAEMVLSADPGIEGQQPRVWVRRAAPYRSYY